MPPMAITTAALLDNNGNDKDISDDDGSGKGDRRLQITLACQPKG